jgi:glycosyltransferase involved in cell wall biosynthesis
VPSKPRVLVLSLDAIGPGMAGVAIRAAEVAQALAPHADVTLAAARRSGDVDLGLPVVDFDRHDGRSLERHLHDVDAVVCQPQWPLVARVLRRSAARLVYDLSGPDPLEMLELLAGAPAWRRRLITAATTDRVVQALRDGHHFTASTDRQLDLWIGTVLGAGLLTPRAYAADPSFASRMALVPFGVPEEPPRRSAGPGLRGTVAGIEEGDEVILWNSVAWGWLDPDTAVEAMALLAPRRPRARLVFLSPADASRPAGVEGTRRARALAARRGLLGSSVLFHETWVPYAERGDWLLDADCAVACHALHLETRFAFRTRYLDCLWAGLPLVCTQGDVLAERVEREDLGATVPPGEAGALADALEQVLGRGRDGYAEPLARAAERRRWSVVTRPLVELVLGGTRPPRLGDGVPRRPGHALRDAAYRAVKRLTPTA